MKALARTALVATAAASGAYTIVYLYRWEWHRAIVAGIFLVVAEVAIAAGAILGRLRAIDQRLNEVAAASAARPAAPASAPSPEVLQRVREAAPAPRPPFAWLEPGRMSVFLPILLGAGVIASGVAWAVETLGRATAGPVLERRLATRLSVFALPAGGLLAPAPAVAPVRSRRFPARARTAVILVLVVVAGGLGIDALADATQTRPDETRAGVVTVVEIHLRGEVANANPDRVVAALWQGCTGTLQRQVPEPVVASLGDARFRLVIPVEIGPSASRRLHGCLEDAGVDRVQAGVAALRTVG